LEIGGKSLAFKVPLLMDSSSVSKIAGFGMEIGPDLRNGDSGYSFFGLKGLRWICLKASLDLEAEDGWLICEFRLLGTLLLFLASFSRLVCELAVFVILRTFINTISLININ
jgi:hypothetical protein